MSVRQNNVVKSNVLKFLTTKRYYVSAHGGLIETGSLDIKYFVVPRNTMLVFLTPVGASLSCSAPAFYRWLFDSQRLEKVILSQSTCRGFFLDKKNNTTTKPCVPLQGTIVYISGDTVPDLSLGWIDFGMDLGVYRLPLDDSPPLHPPESLNNNKIQTLKHLVEWNGPGVYVISACRSFPEDVLSSSRKAAFESNQSAIQRDIYMYNNVINTGISSYFNPRNVNNIKKYFHVPKNGPLRPWLKPRAALQAAPDPRTQTAPPQAAPHDSNLDVSALRLRVQMAMFEATDLENKTKADKAKGLSDMYIKRSWESFKIELDKYKLVARQDLEDMKYYTEHALATVTKLNHDASITTNKNVLLIVSKITLAIKDFLDSVSIKLSSNGPKDTVSAGTPSVTTQLTPSPTPVVPEQTLKNSDPLSISLDVQARKASDESSYIGYLHNTRQSISPIKLATISRIWYAIWNNLKNPQSKYYKRLDDIYQTGQFTLEHVNREPSFPMHPKPILHKVLYHIAWTTGKTDIDQLLIDSIVDKVYRAQLISVLYYMQFADDVRLAKARKLIDSISDRVYQGHLKLEEIQPEELEKVVKSGVWIDILNELENCYYLPKDDLKKIDGCITASLKWIDYFSSNVNVSNVNGVFSGTQLLKQINDVQRRMREIYFYDYKMKNTGEYYLVQ